MDPEDRDKLDAERGYREVSIREVRMGDWLVLGSRQERDEFQRLIWRLQARKHWKAKDPERKARILAYRRQWALDHPERVKEYMRKAKAKRRDSGATAKESRKRRAKKRAERIESIVYTCTVCGQRWQPDPSRRLPSRRPKYCSQRCRSRAANQRLKEAETATGSGLLIEHVGYGGRIELLHRLGGELTTARLVASLGYSKKYAAATLNDLYRRGHLRRVGRGVYRVAEEREAKAA